jgi:hypothetical protein
MYEIYISYNVYIMYYDLYCTEIVNEVLIVTYKL